MDTITDALCNFWIRVQNKTKLDIAILIAGILLAVIVRGQDIIIPEGSTCLRANDNVILISRNSGVLDLNDIYGDTPLVREGI